MKVVKINLWDDYLEDEDVPPGTEQETNLYVEESRFSAEQKKLYLAWLLPHLQRLAPDTVRFELVDVSDPESEYFDGPAWQFKIFGLSHVARETLVKQLRAEKLHYSPSVRFDIYTES